MSSALRSGRTLKPMMIAFDADASSTSDSLIAPTPAVNDADLDLLVGQLGQRVGQHFGRALHVGLDDDRQLLHAAFGNLRLQRLERQAAALARRARLSFACSWRNVRDLPRLGRVGQRLERVAGLRQAAETEHFDRRRRPADFDRPAAVVDERAHACRRSGRR